METDKTRKTDQAEAMRELKAAMDQLSNAVLSVTDEYRRLTAPERPVKNRQSFKTVSRKRKRRRR